LLLKDYLIFSKWYEIVFSHKFGFGIHEHMLAIIFDNRFFSDGKNVNGILSISQMCQVQPGLFQADFKHLALKYVFSYKERNYYHGTYLLSPTE
jgi:hypothetical protein